MKLVVKTELEAHYTRRKKHSETVWLDDFRPLQSSDVVSNQVIWSAEHDKKLHQSVNIKLALSENGRV